MRYTVHLRHSGYFLDERTNNRGWQPQDRAGARDMFDKLGSFQC